MKAQACVSTLTKSHIQILLAALHTVPAHTLSDHMCICYTHTLLLLTLVHAWGYSCEASILPCVPSDLSRFNKLLAAFSRLLESQRVHYSVAPSTKHKSTVLDEIMSSSFSLIIGSFPK